MWMSDDSTRVQSWRGREGDLDFGLCDVKMVSPPLFNLCNGGRLSTKAFSLWKCLNII